MCRTFLGERFQTIPNEVNGLPKKSKFLLGVIVLWASLSLPGHLVVQSHLFLPLVNPLHNTLDKLENEYTGILEVEARPEV